MGIVGQVSIRVLQLKYNARTGTKTGTSIDTPAPPPHTTGKRFELNVA